MLMLPCVLRDCRSVSIPILHLSLMLLDCPRLYVQIDRRTSERSLCKQSDRQFLCGTPLGLSFGLTSSFLSVVFGLNLTLMSTSSNILFIGSAKPRTYGSVTVAFSSLLGSSGFTVLVSLLATDETLRVSVPS